VHPLDEFALDATSSSNLLLFVWFGLGELNKRDLIRILQVSQRRSHRFACPPQPCAKAGRVIQEKIMFVI